MSVDTFGDQTSDSIKSWTWNWIGSAYPALGRAWCCLLIQGVQIAKAGISETMHQIIRWLKNIGMSYWFTLSFVFFWGQCLGEHQPKQQGVGSRTGRANPCLLWAGLQFLFGHMHDLLYKSALSEWDWCLRYAAAGVPDGRASRPGWERYLGQWKAGTPPDATTACSLLSTVMPTWTGCCRKSVLLERVFCPIPSCAPVKEDWDPPSKEQVKQTKEGEEQSDFRSGHLGKSKNCANIYDASLLFWPRLFIFTSEDFLSLWFV